MGNVGALRNIDAGKAWALCRGKGPAECARRSCPTVLIVTGVSIPAVENAVRNSVGELVAYEGEALSRVAKAADLECVAVDDEAGTFGELVVETLCGFVGLVGLPVDA